MSGTETALQGKQGLGGRGWAKTVQQKEEHGQRLGAVLSLEGGSGDGERPLFLMELKVHRVAEGNEIARSA